MRNAIPASVILFVCLVLIACHKDNNDITIQGKWLQQSIRIQQYSNNTPIDDTTYVFSSTSYEFTNNGIAIYKDEVGDTLHFTYTYDENMKKLVTSKDGDLYEYDVIQLTANEMMWHEEDSATSGADTYKLTYDISLKR